MPPKAKGKEKATPEKPAPVLSMRLQMKMAEEESKKKEAEKRKANSESESEPESKVDTKSRSRARPSKTESKAKRDASSASECEQETSPKSNQRRSTRVAAPPVSTDKDSGSKGKAGRAPVKRGRANQKAAAEQSADESSESESDSEDAEPAKPAKKSTKAASKSAKKKAESSSESESEEEEPVRGSKGGRNKTTAKAPVTKKEQKKAPTKTTTKRGKKETVSEKQASDSDDLLDSSDSNSDSDSSNSNSGDSSEGEAEQKNAKSPQKRIGRPPGAKNKPKADQTIDTKCVPEVIALDMASATVSAPVVAAANRIKKKGMILDSEVEDQPIFTTSSVSADTSAAAENKASVNFVLPADSSLLKLTQLGKTTSTIPRSASSMSIASNNSITDLAGSSDIITAAAVAKQSSIKRIGKKEHANAEFLNSVKINRGEWLKGFEKKIDASQELSGARKAAHHSSSYSSSYTSTNTSYSDHHSSSTALALWGTLFDDQKTQDATRVFLEKVRMQVDKNNLKKTDKAAYQSVCAVVDKCDMYAVYDKDMYTYTEPSEYKRFIDMSLVLQDESVYALSDSVQAEIETAAVATTNNTTTAANATTPSTATLASPYEIENETVPKPLHIVPNPNDVAKALSWWGMRPDDALLQEIDRKRAVRAQEYHIKVRQAAEKAEQERLKMLELLAKQKADDERRLKWLERANRKPTATSTAAVNTGNSSEGAKPSVVAPPAPVRPAQPVRGPRDRDYSHPAVKPVAPPIPAPPTLAAPVAPPLPVAAAPVPPPPPVLIVPTTTNTSKIHKDRDYGSTSTLGNTIDKPATAATTAVTTTDDPTRTRRKSRDYSDEPSIIPSTQTTASSVTTNAVPKVPAKAVAKDRDYANSGSKDHSQVSKDNSRDTTKSSSARTRDRSDSRQRDRGRADSRERSRESAKDPFGRDLIREPNRVQNKEPNGEVSKGQDRSRGGKRSRSRSAPRSVHTIANANKPNPTNSNATKNNSNNDRNSDSFRSINTTGTTHTSNKNRTVSPVLSRALSTGRDGPRGGPSPPTVKSTVSTTYSTAGSSSGGFRDGSSKSTAKDSRDGSNRDACAPVHVSSKVVVPSNTSSARNSTNSTAATISSGVSSGGQKRPRSPSPSGSNKKDALGRSVPALLVTTRERNNDDTATNKTSANDKEYGYDQKDKPLTPTSSYRERNVPRPQPGNSHLPHRDHNHHQGQGRSQDSAYNQNRSNAGNNNAQNQPSSRTVHVGDRNYSESNNRQYNNGNRDRSRQY